MDVDTVWVYYCNRCGRATEKLHGVNEYGPQGYDTDRGGFIVLVCDICAEADYHERQEIKRRRGL